MAVLLKFALNIAAAADYYYYHDDEDDDDDDSDEMVVLIMKMKQTVKQITKQTMMLIRMIR